MTTTATLIGAASSSLHWDSIDWKPIKALVRRLQMRISKAVREGRWGKVKALQWLLTHSFAAKLLAVKRVVSNAGRKTAGVDGVIWRTSEQKRRAARSLRRRGYQALPLRRIYIPKKNGKRRGLGIPVMCDRSQQALHLLSLEPVAETKADPNSYGCRPKRSAADAIAQCFNSLAKRASAQWIFEADVKACFDRISHPWLIDHVPMDKQVLRKWLAAGYMEDGVVYPTEEGTPQGGIISPTLANWTLDGLEEVAHKAVGSGWKINFVRYADDFIITSSSKEVLETIVQPAVAAFLKERGLELSAEKTKITHIDEGFDFLGFNVRKYGGKLLIKPAKEAVKRFLDGIRVFIKSHTAIKTEDLIRQLNRKISGWTNYYRHVVSKDIFSYVDYQAFRALVRWTKRRHPEKSKAWRKQRYFRVSGGRQWTFFAKSRDAQGKTTYVELIHANSVSITRHVKIQSDANPYDPKDMDYFTRRANARREATYTWRGAGA